MTFKQKIFLVFLGTVLLMYLAMVRGSVSIGGDFLWAYVMLGMLGIGLIIWELFRQ